jgi:hypothetical protein
MKMCKTCKVSKELSRNNFYLSKTNKDGFRADCIICSRNKSSKWCQDNKDKRRKYRRDNREHTLEMDRKYAISSPYAFIGRIFDALRSNRHKTHQITVTIDYVRNLYDKQEGKCALSKVKMVHKRHDLRAISIDRINSEKGYEEDNIQLVCKFINLGKWTHSNQEVIEFLSEIPK